MFQVLKKIIFYSFIIYTFIGFVILPFILKPQLVDLISSKTNAEITINNLYFNPYIFKLELCDVSLRDKEKNPLVSFGEFSINIDPSSLVIGAVHIKELSIKSLSIHMVHNKDNSINLLKIVKESNSSNVETPIKTDIDTKIPRIIIDSVKLSDSSVNYIDYTREEPFEISLDKIGFKLQSIDTQESNNSKGELRFYSNVDGGGFLDLKTKILSYEPFAVSGSINFEASKIYTVWKYVKEDLNLEIADGKVSFNAEYIFNLDDLNATKIDNINIALEKLRVIPKDEAKDILNLGGLYIADTSVEPLKRKVKVGHISIDSFALWAERKKDGNIDWEKYVEVKQKKKSTPEPLKASKNDEKWSVVVDEVKLKKSMVSFKDSTLQKPVTSTVDSINVSLYDLNLEKGSWLSYESSFKINKKGSVVLNGKLCNSPLKQVGIFDIQDISLSEITPYLQETLYVAINDGRFSLNGKSKYEASKQKPDLVIESSFELNSLFVNDTQDNSLLLSLNEVKTEAFSLELSPNRFYINELDINSFYVNAMIDKNKSMNFSKLSKKVKSKETLKTEGQAVKKKEFPINIVKVKVSSGSAKFADYSIPIRFNTYIHDLNGVIYAISNRAGETSYVNISGEVDEYGSTQLQGSIDSSNPKAFTDLDFNFRNLELSSLSGYSATFAGHEIESGKLYLDLGYDILNSELEGSNSVIIKQPVLGAEVDDENVTVLPLGFVFGLLEDSDGVIDIDMPVKGNIDEPDFKYGMLVLKTIGGLITKAVTSPFKFLAAAMGIDAEELSFVVFDPGEILISPPQREKLDQVAKMLIKKPKISLKIAGVYNIKSDKKSLQLDKLITLMMQKSGSKNREEQINSMSIDLLESVYIDIVGKEALENLADKQKEKTKEHERAYYNELLALTIDIQKVSKAEFEKLADARIYAITSYLTLEKGINKSRISKGDDINVLDAVELPIKVNMEIEVK